MKQYPKYDAPEGERGFTEEEIKRGLHALYIDVTCEDCGKVQSAAQANGTDGHCIKCGGRVR